MKFELRSIDFGDHEWLVALHNDPLVLRNLTHPEPISIEDHLQWWRQVSVDPNELRLIFTVDGERAGLTKFYDIDFTNDNCWLGADLHATYRGQGLAKHMWKLMLKKCFGEFDFHRVSLTTADFNDVAQRVYQKLGFKEEGRYVQSLYRDGVYHDEICMYLLKEGHDDQ